MPENASQKQDEALYLLDDNVYLHLQETENGWNYAVYEKEALILLAEGFMDHKTMFDSPMHFLIPEPHAESRSFEELAPTKVELCDPAFMVEMRRELSQLGKMTLPDPEISVTHMHNTGFHDPDMLPLTQDRALELAEHGVRVYVLYADNTKHFVSEPRDIAVTPGLYGVTREDWESAKETIPLRNVEQRFLDRPDSMMAIYQLKDTADADLRFRSFDRLDNPPKRENYDCVYTNEIHSAMPVDALLEQQFSIFNLRHPADFTGHSMSVSDIVGIKRDGKLSFHYCDSFGFRELESFLPENYLKNAEMSLEDDYGMIDGIINNGKSHPPSEGRPEKERDSVLEALNKPVKKPIRVKPRKRVLQR